MRYTRPVPAILLALMAAACGSADAPVAPVPVQPAAERAVPQARLHTPDHEFARVSRAEVPGFAGFYLREDGTPVVRLVDPRQRGAAQRYLAQEIVRARRGRHADAPQQPVFLQAAYDFAQLKEWADALTPILERSDVFLIDVDEVENRVSVGAQDAAAMAAVRAQGSQLGIPAAALHVRTQPRPEQRITVRDKHNPTLGGIQIASTRGLCTLGFHATRSDGQFIFVTSSHCTPSHFALDGGNIHQNVISTDPYIYNVIGYEMNDVGTYNCGIAPTPCRMSDASYIFYNFRSGRSPGMIARTPWPSSVPGPASTFEIAPYEIVGRLVGYLPVGAWLDKTGRTSGSTYGQVIASCVSIGDLRCQDVSSTWSQAGDSGAPVYYYLGGTGALENDVLLRGLMWGGPANDNTVSYSSPLAGIEADLGPLSGLCAYPNPC